MFKNVKIIHTEVEDGKYNDNKKKFIKYKRPKKIVKYLLEIFFFFSKFLKSSLLESATILLFIVFL